MSTRPWSGPTAVAVLALVIALAGIGVHPAQAGAPQPTDGAADDGAGLLVTGTFNPMELEGDRAGDHGERTAGWLETSDGSAVLVRFSGPTAIEAGATITISLDPAGGTGSIVRDVERLVAVRPLTAATSPRRASPTDASAPEAKAAPGGGGPEALAATTPKKMLIIPVWCSHENGSTTVAPMPTSPTPLAFEQHVTSTVSPWFDQFSWHHRTFTPRATPWYDICPSWGALPLSPEAVAASHGYVPGAYDRVVMVVANTTGSLGAAEGVPGRRAILFNSSLDPGVWAHELGHLEGMVHANTLRCVQGVPVMYSLSGTCTSDEYGDRSDSMGDTAPDGGFSAVEADQVGWLGPSVMTTVTAPAKVRIANYALPLSAFTMRAVKIPLPSGTYYVERRAAVGWDAGLAGLPGLTSGVLVRVEAGAVDSSQFPETWQRHGNLLDATPSTPTFDDASLPMNQVFVTPEGVRIWAAPATGGLTTVYVDFPVGLTAPSNPQLVKANVLANGTVSVTWDPPVRNPGNLTYEIRTTDPGQAPITTTSLSALLPPLPDGSSAVGVRAYVTGNPAATSQFAASLPQYAFPLPSTPSISVLEGTGTVNVPHTVTLTLPWVPFGGADRNLGLYPGTAGTTDFVVAGALVAFSWSTATYTFEVVPDGLPEGNETMDIFVVDQRCMAGWIVPDCAVPTSIATVTIVDDD